MPGYFIYCRKSTEAEDRQVLSIESQVRELREVAAKLQLPITEVLSEAKSAKEPGRPVFNSMMQRLYRGEASGVICWKLDRLARNPVDGGSVIWAIKQHSIKVLTPAQTFGHNDDNVILMYIEFGMAQKYVDDLSRNVKRGLKAKAEKGWYSGIPPLGYLNNRVKLTGESILIRDPERFPLIRRMWDLMLTGLYTPPRILEIANQEWGLRTRRMRKLGGLPLCRSAIYRIFTSPFYYGWFEHPRGSGNWYQGKHASMITETEYNRVQSLLGRKGNPRSNSRTFAFTGLIRCGDCDGMVTAEEKNQLICGNCRFKFAYRRRDDCPCCHTKIEKMSNPLFLTYTYYHCSKSKNPHCSQKSLKGEELEKQIAEFLSRFRISKAFKTWAIAYLHEFHAKESSARNDILESQQRAYQECLRRIDNLVNLKTSPYNADGAFLTDQEYGSQRAELLKEKARLEELLRDTGHRAEKWLDLSDNTIAFARAARDRFYQGDANTKKGILAALGSNLILKDKTLRIEALKPFLLLESASDGRNTNNRPIEPEKIGSMLRQNGTGESPCPTLCGQRDEARTYGPNEEKIVQEIYHFFRSLPEPDLECWPLHRLATIDESNPLLSFDRGESFQLGISRPRGTDHPIS